MSWRSLTPAERSFIYQVHNNSLNYDAVSISDLGISGQVITTHFNGSFTIRWDAGYRGIMGNERSMSTLIHEMTHVWQGDNNGYLSGTYQVKSAGAQFVEGVKDIVRTGDYKGAVKNWDDHRGTAYRLDASRFGQPWSSFNVEQQAMIVETWYLDDRVRKNLHGDCGPGVFGASMSPYDARFPYIRDNIRKRSQTAGYSPVVLPTGANAAIKAIQDKLVALDYLDPRMADGLIGRSHSKTLDAVQDFQRRNGLQAGRDLGGANSKTRAALAKPVNQLQRGGR